jgi:glycerol-3-phosphate acyltransferase PlsX
VIRIAIDAMGGDHAPQAIVEGAIGAVELGFAHPGEVILVGHEERLALIIREKKVQDLGIQIVHAGQVVEMGETPVDALRRKPDSSIVKAIGLLKEKGADAMISAGNTGAVVAASMFMLGMLKGIRRPGIGVLFHTQSGPCTIIDVGANIHCKPLQLFQYGGMAANYMQYVMGAEQPRIAMINVGEEDEKGTSLLRETHALFEASPLNFIGNIEGQYLFSGKCDVLVCDGFVGNVILKVSEGLGAYLQNSLIEYMEKESEGQERNLWQKILKDIIARLDYAEYGGAPLLGVNGNVFISHGRSDARAIYNAIRVARISVEQKVNEHITTGLSEP